MRKSWLRLETVFAVATVCCSGRHSDTGERNACEANLLPGDLVITEIMANPEGSDEGKEWFEVFNASERDVVLDGVVFASAKIDGTGEKTLTVYGVPVSKGQYLVLGNAMPAVAAPWVDYAYAASLGDLRNTAGGKLRVMCGETVIDEVVFPATTEGKSWALDGSLPPDAQRNDDPNIWCEQQDEYEPGNYGTPGKPNGVCASALPAGTCWDGKEIRPMRLPEVGDLVISEFLPDPHAVSDSAGEWVEVFVHKDLDLNGFQMGKDEGDLKEVIPTGVCRPVSAGSWLVFVRTLDPNANGGVENGTGVLKFGLTNSGMTLVVASFGRVLDKVTYSAAQVEPGKAWSLDPSYLNPQQNDNMNNWCPASSAYGMGDQGTPGAPNPSCY